MSVGDRPRLPVPVLEKKSRLRTKDRMSPSHNVHAAIVIPLALFAAASCATGRPAAVDASGGREDAGPVADASCGAMCDQDGDGVFDGDDQCPDTPSDAPVNGLGCADSQLTPVLETTFPPYGLMWTPTGDLGRAGGLTWTYTGIQRGDLFHIYWIVCDDPDTPCGLSLDGPIDAADEAWQFDMTDSDLAAGTLVLTNSTAISLADGTTPALNGRLTLTVVDSSDAALPWADVGTLGVPPREASYGAEIPGTGFTVTALAEVQDPSTSTWTPYLDYYDAAPTSDTSPGPSISFGGSFYDK